MNFLARNDKGEYFLLGIWRAGEASYQVVAIYLLRDGTKRADGGRYNFQSERAAIGKCYQQLNIKRRKKGFEKVELDQLPEPGKVFLKPDLWTFATPDELLEMAKHADQERYVWFNIVTGIEDRFDEGVEYLALQDLDEPDYYDVWDRFGVQCKCHESRFSEIRLTERAMEIRGMLE